MRNVISMPFSRRCDPMLGALFSAILASLMLAGCAPALRLAVQQNTAAEERAHEQRSVVQHFPVQENDKVRSQIDAAVVVPPGRGLPDYCSRAHNVRTKRSACLDTGGRTQPVTYATLHSDGSFAIKLLVYVKTESPTTFHLVRVNTQTKLEKFVTQWDARDRLEETYNKAHSVSPDGKRVALVRNAPALRGAQHFMKQGELVLYDLESNTWDSLQIDVLDAHPVQWLDNNRIVFARALKREEVPASLLDASNSNDEFGDVYARAAFVPVVYLRDLRSNSERALHVGRIAIASPHARALIVQDDAQKMRRLTLLGDTLHAMPLATLPALAHEGIVGFAGPSHVLYWAEPYAGRETQYTLSNSPLVGPKKLLSLRVANIENGEFITVVERVDPRAQPSVTLLKRNPASD
jgi:hypothetical protein